MANDVFPLPHHPWLGAVLLGLAALAVGCDRYEAPIPLQPSYPASAGSTTDLEAKFATRWFGAETLTVAPGVHMLGELFPSAAYAIETPQGVILIDTGVDESGAAVRQGLMAVGLRPEEIRYILLTHAHYDHVFAANRLRELSGAVVCAGRDDCEVLRSADVDALFSLFPREPFSGEPIAIDRELTDGDVIELGGVTIQAIAAPGHTPGSTCYLLENNSQRILFSGDVIASLNFGPATYPAHLAPGYRGDAAAYLDTMDRLLAMPPPDLLLPGHPRQQPQTTSFEVDLHQWRRLLEPAKSELEQVLTRHEQDGADFLDGVAKTIDPGLFYLGELDGTAVYCLERAKRLVLFNAPGGERLPEFVNARLDLVGLPNDRPLNVLLTSDEKADHSGLPFLENLVHVIAPSSAIEPLRKLGVDAVSHQSLKQFLELPIEAISLGDGLAYAFSSGDRSVLVTPRTPRHLTLVWTHRLSGRRTFSPLQPQTAELSDELSASAEAARDYRQSLQALAHLSPQIWLPASPLTGQNAHLYDDDWQTVLDTNRQQAERAADRLPGGG